MKLVAGDSAAHPEIEMIERHGAHAHDRFIRLRNRIGYRGLFQPLDATVLSNYDRFHGAEFYKPTRHDGCHNIQSCGVEGDTKDDQISNRIGSCGVSRSHRGLCPQ